MSEPIRILALEPDETVAAAARQQLLMDERLRFLGASADLQTLLHEVGRSRPQVVLLDLTTIKDRITRSVREVLEAAPDVCVVVTASQATPAMVSRAITAGARGLVLKPYDGRELVSTICEAYENLIDLRKLQQTDRIQHVDGRGKVIAVYSPKGGVGCTTIATNVAIALRARTKRPVAIVDLDLQFGDVGVALDLRGANSIAELVSHSEAVDAALIDDVFVKHVSGVSALLAPDTLDAVEHIGAEQVLAVIEQLRDHFAYVVCDLWSTLDDLTIGVLRTADRIALVTTPELPSLKNLRRAIAATTPLLLDDRTLVVLNRYPSKATLRLPDIERNLGRTVAATIPSDGVGITHAINEGISMFDSRARVRTSGSYRRLADLVATLPSEPEPARVGRAAGAA